MTIVQTSEVLVFPREVFGSVYSLLPWSSVQPYIDEIERSFSWLDRPQAERSEEVVQAIPCVLIKNSEDRYCVFRRVKEGRTDLSGKLSLIIGGHIDQADDQDSFLSAMERNLVREIDEEVGIRTEEPPRPVGVIIDGSSTVTSRHVAFLHEMHAEQVSPSAPEEFNSRSKYTGEFVSASRLGEWLNRFDPWSRLAIEEYICSGDVQPMRRQASLL